MKNELALKMAYYRKEDWELFLKTIDDRERMHETWEEWHDAYQKLKKKLSDEGFEVIDVIIDIEELSVYCKIQGIKNDGNARSKFVLQKDKNDGI